MRLKELIKQMENKLNNIENYKTEVIYIIQSVLNVDKTYIVLNKEKEIECKDVDDIFKHANERLKGRPIQYVLNHQEFMSLDFYVKEGVLIPRQDTETIVEELLKENLNDKKVLDLCCGSGAIGLSVKYYSKDAIVTLADISDIAIEVTMKNAANLVSSNVEIIKTDLFTNIEGEFDIIVSNPPYIKEVEYNALDEIVLSNEPKLALYGGEDGLEFYKRIIEGSKEYLIKEGKLYFEVGFNQAKEVTSILEKNGFINIEVIKDYTGKDRLVRARKI